MLRAFHALASNGDAPKAGSAAQAHHSKNAIPTGWLRAESRAAAGRTAEQMIRIRLGIWGLEAQV